jgi:hypothetical protein
MKVKELRIHRTESYETPGNTLVGYVELAGDNGTQKIRLSATTIGQVFMLILKDATRTAQDNAALVPRAIEESANERLVLEMHTAVADDTPF